MEPISICNGCLSHAGRTKALPCSHKFCSKCLQKCIGKESKRITCLKCHAEWTIQSPKKMAKENQESTNRLQRRRICSSCKKKYIGDTSEDTANSQNLRLYCQDCTKTCDHRNEQSEEKTAAGSRIPFSAMALLLGVLCVVPLAISITYDMYDASKSGLPPSSDSDHFTTNEAVDTIDLLSDEIDLGLNLDTKNDFDNSKYKTTRHSSLELEMTFGSTGPGSSHNPMNIAVSPSGDIAVTDWSQNRVNVFDDSGSFKFKLDTRLDMDYKTTSNPVGVAIASSGHFFVTDFNPWVNVYSTHGDYLFQFQTDTPKNPNVYSRSDLRCLGLTIDKIGRVLVGEYWNNRISIQKPKGAVITSFNVSIEPRFLAVSRNHIAVGCLHCRKPIQVVDYTGKTLFTVKNPFQDKTWSTSGVSFTDYGDILVASNSTQGNAGIYRFSSTGEFVDCVTRDVVNPRGMVTSMDGKKVLVIDNSEVKVFKWV